MKELKILAVVVFFSLVTYWGVEPFAHSQMHKHVEGHGFKYDGVADIEDATKDKVAAKKAFWTEVAKISKMQGDVKAGEAAFSVCTSCHNGSGINMGGVIPPSLDHAGSLYDKDYLIAIIKNPAMATNTDHRDKPHAMAAIANMVSSPQQIADIVAYIKAKKVGNVTSKQAFIEACGRCHANRYGGLTQLGEIPKFKTDKDALAYKIKVLDEQDLINKYMGKLPPDLSIIARARSAHFMETFIENPQSQLPGTSMPRVGLTKEGYEKVYAYLEETGDPSKEARHAVGPWVIGFFVIFTILAYLWKKSQWKDLH